MTYFQFRVPTPTERAPIRPGPQFSFWQEGKNSPALEVSASIIPVAGLDDLHEVVARDEIYK
jgi:hypothetical protein